MARQSYPHSASSQFFINHIDNGFLDYGLRYDGDYYYTPGYCVFGRVISGMSVVNAIALAATSAQGGMTDVPVTPIVIQSAVITLDSPVCAAPLEGDLNGNCVVNLEDLALFARSWLSSNRISP